ncbi:DinB family protein [Planococcus sp. CAU13]|uniref:DinB family protein n=1 Tax=Planococcus sp. CAU13 TaxID=1541197 RepID=UPI0005300524|nr:DinB family protein [Planococcus sp. CAU13]
MIDYVIKSPKGYAGKVGELVSMLEHARAVTLWEIGGLRMDDLDHLQTRHSNSIGALLMHIAAIEKVHQVISFENRDLSEEEAGKWSSALSLGDEGRRNINERPLEYYLEELAEVRRETLKQLKTKDEAWLFEENTWPNGVAFNNYYLWFHVLEDEISHRGQIRMLKREMKKK